MRKGIYLIHLLIIIMIITDICTHDALYVHVPLKKLILPKIFQLIVLYCFVYM